MYVFLHKNNSLSFTSCVCLFIFDCYSTVLSIFLYFPVYFRLSTITLPIFLSWCSSIMCGFSSLSLYGTLIVLYFSHILLNFVFKTMTGWNLCCYILLSDKLVTLILCEALWYWASNSVQTRLAFCWWYVVIKSKSWSCIF